MACYETGVRTALSARSTFEVERWSLGGQRSMSHRRWSGAPARSYTASSVRGTSARSKSWRLSLREPPGEGAGPTGCRPGPRTCLEDCDRFWGADNLKPLAETVHGPNSRLTQESAGNRGWDGSSLRVSFSAPATSVFCFAQSLVTNEHRFDRIIICQRYAMYRPPPAGKKVITLILLPL